MSNWSKTRAEWQQAVTQSLTRVEPESDSFSELDRSTRRRLSTAIQGRAMRKVWDAGLYQQQAAFTTLRGLWQDPTWTAEWLRMLRRQSARTTDEWQQLRRSELKACGGQQKAERDRLVLLGQRATTTTTSQDPGNALAVILHIFQSKATAMP